ncbi:MAG TPA: bifunctional phosphopantothenoylcysteine decarboxylase/phosphopantothenate--cysteine ligase CoaBC [Nitrosomonas sp.]|nr:bifunctional phosphopantothenoylcysteine decarboxylase/phosphopantothenate--cysteine ligase CoaBC [Nitrosomonas sp.]HNH69000.1 bifunctional phosphopantothenoylcysteine decarboxylase/phosphopantothenate--cysteine ligase CoaBC [Nitrosomonas sp.]
MDSISALTGKKLILGITGGIAAYKTAELARLLVKEGAIIQTVMTQAACRFIGPETLHALTGNPVYTELWGDSLQNSMAHIGLSRSSDAILIAPTSANFIAKLAHGVADDLLSTLCLARDCPLIIAPAMNKQMFENPATQRNLNTLHADQITIWGPASGDQACGENGLGRMLEPEQLQQALQVFFEPKWLDGKKVLITAGPTYEAIDAVRGIINLSSGKMGYAIANAASNAGATVTLIAGPVHLPKPSVQKFISVTSATQMLAAVKKEVSNCDIFISVAAVADYRPQTYQPQKIKKANQPLTLELVPNPDILHYVAHLKKPPFCVGFAAETEKLDQYAQKKRQQKRLPLIVANLAQQAMGADESTLILFDDDGKHVLPQASKTELARQLIKHIAQLFEKQNA